MTSQTQLLNTLDSLVGQRVTVPTNPYGGQCVSLVDYVLQYAGLFNLNFSYLNAIDGLDRAESLGLKATYFNGTNNPPVGSVWVTNCLPYHQFGHIGFVVAENPDGTVTTIEQNIDGNADCLENGGWTRKVTRNLDSAGNFSYIDWNAPSQQMVGWFELPFDGMTENAYFIDVSAYQPGDLTSICSASGTNNTVIKVTEGTGWVSPVATQQTNTSNCIGYYHFARFGGDVATAQAEANYFIGSLPSHPRYLVCDYEDGASGDKQANTNAVLAFMDICKEKEEDIMNFVVRSDSGNQGWVAVVNGRVFGIGSMGTVDALEATGAKRLQLEDADFERFLYSQSNDAEAVSKAINEASASVVKAIEERAQATQGQTGV